VSTEFKCCPACGNKEAFLKTHNYCSECGVPITFRRRKPTVDNYRAEEEKKAK